MSYPKPYLDIAERIIWHRTCIEGLIQKDYALKIRHKPSALQNWETGGYRLSLDGALAMQRVFGLSLDFLYLGNDDMLAIALRRAWRERAQAGAPYVTE